MARKPQGDTRPPRTPARERRDSRRSAIPRPSEADFEDVHWALSAASTLWDRGEDTEALKWLRRAASTAAERDADTRAVELFKAAAEVASDIEVRRRAKPAAPPAPEIPLPLTTPKPPATTPKLPATAPTLSATEPFPAPALKPPEAPRPAVRSPAVPRASDPKVPPPSSARRPTVPRVARYGLDSTILPAVPPEPALSEAPRPLIGLRFDESEEETFVRPETLVRRALMAIDPDYARRTAYTSEVDDAPDSALPSSIAGSSWDDSSGSLASPASHASNPLDVPTARAATRASGAPHLPGALPAVRVAVLPIPDERDVRLVFLPPDAEPPPGVAVALLVPLSEEDARRIAELYRECDAKL